MLNLSEDFSNLNRTPMIANFSSSTGCTITAAYVPPAQQIKPRVVHPNEFHRAQLTKIDFATMNLTG